MLHCFCITIRRTEPPGTAETEHETPIFWIRHTLRRELAIVEQHSALFNLQNIWNLLYRLIKPKAKKV